MRRAALCAAAALLQACSSVPTDTPIPGAGGEASPPPAPMVQMEAGQPPVPPTPLEASRLPPFEGEQHTIREPLRGVRKVDRTVEHGDLWQRIRDGFGMPNLDGPLVREKTAYYIARPDYLQRIFDRSRLYLHHIVEELEKRNMPTEIALLPMVESAFNPMAYSRAHASGLWQFIPGTGKRFELQQNWWYDGRRDIVESTKAALDYLAGLYEMHGDWQLALASYNWGENAVARAIAKNRAAGKPTDYASLTMPKETRQYLPKLQALKNIIANPEPFGIQLEPIPNQPYFATYTKLRDIDVQLAAKLAEMPVEEFIALNPGFSRPYIRASLSPRIVLPADKVDVFHDNLTRLDQQSLVSWRTYQPKKGDSFESVAKKHGLTVGQLREVNGISPRTKALPSLIVVPMDAAAASAMGRLPIMYAPPIPVSVRKIFHSIRTGETLASIARRYGVSVEDIRRWNPLSRFSAGRSIVLEVRVAAKGKPRPKARGKPRSRS